MSDEDRAFKEGERYIVIPWTTLDRKKAERVIFARDITAEEASSIIKSLGWLDHRVELE